MGTTLVIVELLIIGFEVLIWISLLLRQFCPGVCSLLDALKAWDPLLAVVVGIAYTLGIVCDRFLGNMSVFVEDHKYVERLFAIFKARKDLPDLNCPEFDGRPDKEFYTNDIFLPHAFDALGNTNRQIRLLRATSINSFITFIVLLVWYRSYDDLCFVDVLLLAIGFVSAWNWYMSRKTYYRNVIRCYYVAQKKKRTSTQGITSGGRAS